jgi:hypothetical protein
MKRRTRLRLVAQAASTRLSLPRALPVFKATPSVALQTLCENGHGLNVAELLECDARRRIHMFPKGAALFELMGRDAIRRLFDFI